MGVADRAGQDRAARRRRRRGEHGAHVGVAGPLLGQHRQQRRLEQARRRVGQAQVARDRVELAGLEVPQVLRVR